MFVTTKKFPLFALILLVLTGSLFTACDNDDDDNSDYDVPSTYNFDNVSYSGQSQRLGMLQELKDEIQTATNGETLDATQLLDMYSHGPNAGFSGTYDDSKQLKSKTLESEQGKFESILQDAAIASTFNQTATDGVAGTITSNDGSKTYFVDGNGTEYAQIVEKGLMGALLYYQATTVYLGDGKMDVDNETVTPGKGTDMEHHWDEAFGYLGVPTDFNQDAEGAVFWGKYSNSRDAQLNTNDRIMDAFIKGRAAIHNKDMAARDEAIAEVRKVWEEIVAGTALHYLNSAESKMDDDAKFLHSLSEAVAVIYSLQFNAEKSISNSSINSILNNLAGSTNFADMDLWNVSASDIAAARTALYSEFDFDVPASEF